MLKRDTFHVRDPIFTRPVPLESSRRDVQVLKSKRKNERRRRDGSRLKVEPPRARRKVPVPLARAGAITFDECELAKNNRAAA